MSPNARSAVSHRAPNSPDQSRILTKTRLCWQAHEAQVTDLVFIDGDQLASASRDTTIKIWDRLDGKILRTLTGHTAAVTCLLYNHNTRTLVSGKESLNIFLIEKSTLSVEIRNIIYILFDSPKKKTL
jgi:WD40 repeat protein